MLAKQIRALSDQVNDMQEIHYTMGIIKAACEKGEYSVQIEAGSNEAAVLEWLKVNGFTFLRVNDNAVRCFW